MRRCSHYAEVLLCGGGLGEPASVPSIGGAGAKVWKRSVEGRGGGEARPGKNAVSASQSRGRGAEVPRKKDVNEKGMSVRPIVHPSRHRLWYTCAVQRLKTMNRSKGAVWRISNRRSIESPPMSKK